MAGQFAADARHVQHELAQGKSDRVQYDKGQADALHWAAAVLPERMPPLNLWDQARVLAEVQVKRRILDDIVPAMNGMDDRIDGEWGVGAMDPSEYESVDLLRLLALPYADHPEYQDEWRPDGTR
ncbi:DUF6221 family protein [Streptomyces rubiginosohelvolus]